MRGGLQLHDAYDTTFEERKAISEMVKDNIKTTKETQLPFF
jgi:hypothetical protein